ncbi:hypothetical protein BJY00DRAFT_282595 [Aspergillus carlsbadensis]|nr:hypothetical protein BJY00DRAFT_282595 [Aspergillus carlsbadensis]
MPRQRKAHHKSRAGCTQCKERHIRCDEAHPRCLNCKRLELHCSFASLTLVTMPGNNDSLADFELLDYWYRHPLLPGSVEQDRELRHAYVRLGFSYPFLLSSILALVSLRRFDEDRTCTRWYIRAIAHQQAAISLSRPYLHRLESPHQKAILAFSTFTSLYAVAEPLHRPASRYLACSEFDPVEEFVHAMRLSRGSSAFVQHHLRSVIASDAFMAAKYSPVQLKAACDLEAPFPQLRTLRNAILGISEDCERRAVYLDAVERLFVCMNILLDSDNGNDNDNAGNSHRLMVIFAWTQEVDRTFWDLCSARHPVALVIMGHFAALMSLKQGIWFLQHWPVVLLRYIQEKVTDGRWGDLLRWPVGIVSRGDRVACFS